MSSLWWTSARGDGPLIAAAVHAGHATRSALDERFALSDVERRREEDPFTDVWARRQPTHIVLCRSRFEVDLNRPRELAVYRTPEDAWGLDVWKEPIEDELVEDSLALYDSFYRELDVLLRDLRRRHGRFVLFDLHNYNFRRGDPGGEAADPARNPDINIGTGGMRRERWADVLDAFIDELRRHEYRGRKLDVRENVRFRGGELPKWVHRHFADGCAIAVEVKKFFMDEWTGEATPGGVEAVGEILDAATDAVRRRLR